MKTAKIAKNTLKKGDFFIKIRQSQYDFATAVQTNLPYFYSLLFRNCALVQNTKNEVKIGLNTISDEYGECHNYERGYEFDHYLFTAKVMSGACLTFGGLALVMTIVCQFLWAGMFYLNTHLILTLHVLVGPQDNFSGSVWLFGK